MRIGHAHDNPGPLAPDWVDVAPVKDASAKPYRLWRKLLPSRPSSWLVCRRGSPPRPQPLW